MRLLVIDPHGDGLDVALRAQRDDHEVRYFVRPSNKTENIGKGLVNVVSDFKDWLRWADVVFAADNTVYLRDLQGARNEGHLGIIAATEETASWEINRPVGQQIFRKHGIPTIRFRQFDDYDTAIRFVKREDRRFVSKPCGDDDKDKALSYVSKSPEDMVYMLERWQELGKLKNPFILQDFVDGSEMAVGAFCGPNGFIEGWCENWEHKKFMNNDLGISTGEMGTVMRFVRQSKLAKKVLAPLEAELIKQQYTGYIDVNCIIDDAGEAWPLEFTMRPGWPTYNIQMALMKGDTAQWLLDLTKGTDPRIWIYDSVAIGAAMCVPDFPYSHSTQREVCGIPIYGIKPNVWEHVHPCCMMMGSAPKKANGSFHDLPMPVTAGDYVLIMTAVAPTVRDAANTLYRRLGNLIVPTGAMYRTDIGRRLGKQLPKIQSHGFATAMVYSPTV
jgi:phosphoribosylamine--glycine ligase